MTQLPTSTSAERGAPATSLGRERLCPRCFWTGTRHAIHLTHTRARAGSASVLTSLHANDPGHWCDDATTVLRPFFVWPTRQCRPSEFDEHRPRQRGSADLYIYNYELTVYDYTMRLHTT